MRIGLPQHEHEISCDTLLRTDSRRWALVHRVSRLFTVAFCAIALAGCNCIIRSSIISQAAHSKNITKPKRFTVSKSRTPIPAALLMPQTANNKTVTASKKFTESQSRTLIPLPAALLLSRQQEPNCTFETAESNADEHQKLDYERQCYRHAEMIVRSQLQLLQDSVDRMKSVIKGAPIPLPEAPLRSPQPKPSCEFETAASSNADARQKLDYERQCYRHAEMIVRSRLRLLQDSVEKTISAIQRSERRGSYGKRGGVRIAPSSVTA